MAGSSWRRALGRLADVVRPSGTRKPGRGAPTPPVTSWVGAPADLAPWTDAAHDAGVPERAPLPPAAPPRRGSGQATEYTGPVELGYAPRDDQHPDPGEIVWAWVPFEEGDGRGKDRPVLVIGRDGDGLLGLMLSSKDHDLDAADEARHGRHWVDVGTGGWDRQGRPSEVRVDRVLRIDPADVRREGAALGRREFDAVAEGVRRFRR
ncbi:type II toxin-antitoxin system PemK/MazF family toxin [Modestobacter italicus]|uniref:type II toxin-antitoxin system PemK/MazF family toxin n=1 Tax=Modestobacter italicus (strain DSM 44449 / CECT 9708 / BC 501) TaxID=2732864 RepID=UPI001C9412F7|nr:type II toxin-antitoxin system PemK/MazF family toxin [Modestobacter italicus]